MPQTFREYLTEQEPSSILPSSASQPKGPMTFREFLTQQETGPTIPIPSTPQLQPTEPQGFFATLTAQPRGLGQDIAQMLPSRRAAEESFEQAGVLEEQLRQAAPERLEKIQPIPEGLLPERRTGLQTVGDIVGTAIWATPLPAALRAAKGATFLAKLGRGAAGGAAIGATVGGAGALSEESPDKLAIRMIQGTVGGGVLGTAGTAAAVGVGKLIPKMGAVWPTLARNFPIKYISSLGARYNLYGEEGTILAEMIRRADTKKLVRTAQALTQVDNAGIGKLTEEELWKASDSLVDILEGKTSPSNVRVAAVSNTLRGLFKEVATEAQERNVIQQLRRGVTRLFQPRENFVPHFTTPIDEMKKKGVIWQESIEKAIQRGDFENPKAAVSFTDDYVNWVERGGLRGGGVWLKRIQYQMAKKKGFVGSFNDFSKQYRQLLRDKIAPDLNYTRALATRFYKQAKFQKFNSLEFARELDFPLWDVNPSRFVLRYFEGSYKRLAEIEEFGQKGETISALVSKLYGKVDKKLLTADEVREFDKLIKIGIGQIEHSPKDIQTAQFLLAANIPKLTFSQIINLGQSLTNTSFVADLPSVARGFALAFKNTEIRKTMRMMATLESSIREALRKTGVEGGRAGELMQGYLNIIQYTNSERFNRILAGSIGIEHVQKLLRQIIKPNIWARLFKAKPQIFINELKELGLTEVEIQQAALTGKFSDTNLLTTAQRFIDKTQFRVRPIDLPSAISTSPFWKVMFQFKSFAFNQSKLIKDEMKKNLTQRGWYGRAKAMRQILIMSSIFPLTGEVLKDIQVLLTGEDRPTKAWDRFWEDVSYGGGLGLFYDLYQQLDDESKLHKFIAGPTGQSAFRLTALTTKMLKGEELTDADKRFLIKQFGATRPLANILYPPPKR